MRHVLRPGTFSISPYYDTEWASTFNVSNARILHFYVSPAAYMKHVRTDGFASHALASVRREASVSGPLTRALHMQ